MAFHKCRKSLALSMQGIDAAQCCPAPVVVDFADLSPRAATRVDRILRDAKPARALGLTIPPALLLRANRVIE